MPNVLSELFEPFWNAVTSGPGATTVVANPVVNHQNVPVVKRTLHNSCRWIGESGLTEILIRPVYDDAVSAILAGLTNNNKYFYIISGSSGMGKTQFVGYLIQQLLQFAAVPYPSFHIHYSEQSSKDVWFYFVDVNGVQTPRYTTGEASPLPNQALPNYYISDTYAECEKKSDRLHLHIISVASNSDQFCTYVQKYAFGTIIFPPFSRSEHVWCMGSWVSLAVHTANQNATAAAEVVRRTARLGARPGHMGRSQLNYDLNVQAITAQVNGQYQNNTALTICGNFGGDNTIGVWSNWEELQYAYDVFGGCIRLLRLPTPLFPTENNVLKVRSKVDEYFADVMSANGQPVVNEFDATLQSIAMRLVLELGKIRKLQRTSQMHVAVLQGMVRTLYEHVVSSVGYVRKTAPASKFMTWYLADAGEQAA